MIRVIDQPEPPDFNDRVRIPGRQFLVATPQPSASEWRTHRYWNRVSDALYQTYGQICAYSCHWIPPDTGFRTCEHFVPKDAQPDMAYEWRNYRLVCGVLNGRKGTRQVVDPFLIQDGWFVIDFPSLMVKPAVGMAADRATAVNDTIVILGLNDEGTCVPARLEWLRSYCQVWHAGGGPAAIQHLRRFAPFLAKEIVRQRLEDRICGMMDFRFD